MTTRAWARIVGRGLAIGVAAATLPLTVALALAVGAVVVLETGRRAGL